MIRTTYNDLRYLHVQVGELSEWIDDPSWYARYVLHLSQRFNMIQPHLPSVCASTATSVVGCAVSAY
jgi:hypothetical protein